MEEDALFGEISSINEVKECFNTNKKRRFWPTGEYKNYDKEHMDCKLEDKVKYIKEQFKIDENKLLNNNKKIKKYGIVCETLDGVRYNENENTDD